MKRITKRDKVNYIVITMAQKSTMVKDVRVISDFGMEYVSMLMNDGDLYQYKIDINNVCNEWYDGVRKPDVCVNSKDELIARLMSVLF